MNEKHKLKHPKWIVFGGSYAGSLALWARQKYPELIAGAVGSSPLLQPRVDFWNPHNSLKTYTVHIAKNVPRNIRIGFAQMIDMLGSKIGRDQLSELFKLANISIQ
ncbi:hypothetical protein OSTOST_24539 [Ostertagia ostertagi]